MRGKGKIVQGNNREGLDKEDLKELKEDILT